MKNQDTVVPILKHGRQDRLRRQDERLNLDQILQYSAAILGVCFEVMNELGIGWLVNFNRKKIDYHRLHHPMNYLAAEGDPAHHVFS